MNEASDFPEIAFKCPKVWAQMRGDERTRFCDVCNRHVHNLSMMTRQERGALLSAEGESPCVTYFTHLDGTPVDVTAMPATDPLKHLFARAAALSLGAVSMLPACSAPSASAPEPAEKNPSALFIPGMTTGSYCIDGTSRRRQMLQWTVQGG